MRGFPPPITPVIGQVGYFNEPHPKAEGEGNRHGRPPNDQDRTPLTRIRCRHRLPILLRLVPLALMLGASSALAFRYEQARSVGKSASRGSCIRHHQVCPTARRNQPVALGGQQETRRRDLPRNALSGSVETSWGAPGVTLRLRFRCHVAANPLEDMSCECYAVVSDIRSTRFFRPSALR
jgi:hypothetical protein